MPDFSHHPPVCPGCHAAMRTQNSWSDPDYGTIHGVLLICECGLKSDQIIAPSETAAERAARRTAEAIATSLQHLQTLRKNRGEYFSGNARSSVIIDPECH